MSEPLPLGWSLIVVMALIGMNGFFAAANAAIAKARINRIEQLEGSGTARNVHVRSILGSQDLYSAACRLGMASAVVGLGWIGYMIAINHVSPWFAAIGMKSGGPSSATAFLIVYIGVVALHLVFGELIPRRAVQRNAESAIVLLTPPLRFLYVVLSPAVRPLQWIANGFMPLFGIDPTKGHGDAHTEADLRLLMKESHKRGYIDQTELTLVDNIFEFTDTTAREIMIPRTEMICLRAGLSLAANKAIAIQHMRTRYPVCEHDKDNIIGFVHIKDLLKDDLRLPSGMASLIRPVTTVPETIPISALLKLMQRKRSQIAILIDEYGGTSGLVTLEDIMEEIVGDIQDEFDTDVSSIVKRDDGTYSISGLMLIEEVNSFFGTTVDTDEYDTIGGWMYARIDFPPARGQSLTLGSEYELLIEETLHLRISRITIRPLGLMKATVQPAPADSYTNEQ
ncbi:hemolysin family protein [Paenibacillus sp. LHD-117]|uniref:hemolysin family protein n=1 Tax=Paenibacillus sp. LHD-117 TaxID=3071412 RepID=UPI0027E15927|nr:hemolysin family protein [Paenibacillus sp. LHD-117]MDQ6418579.1 hemolysin family protein [Paenibacillus sp. LHD-117]